MTEELVANKNSKSNSLNEILINKKNKGTEALFVDRFRLIIGQMTLCHRPIARDSHYHPSDRKEDRSTLTDELTRPGASLYKGKNQPH